MFLLDTAQTDLTPPPITGGRSGLAGYVTQIIMVLDQWSGLFLKRKGVFFTNTRNYTSDQEQG